MPDDESSSHRVLFFLCRWTRFARTPSASPNALLLSPSLYGGHDCSIELNEGKLDGALQLLGLSDNVLDEFPFLSDKEVEFFKGLCALLGINDMTVDDVVPFLRRFLVLYELAFG